MASQVDRFYPNSRDAGDCPFAGDAEAILGHVGDKANPHAVTAGQVGAYTKAEANAAISAHAGRADNPHAVTAEQVGALTKSAADDRYVRVPPDAETIVLNHLLRGLRFYAHNDAEAGPDGNSPFFVIGSQLSGGQLREDRWVAKLFYNAIEFLRAPGTERVRLEFNRPGAAARATSEAIVLWKEMVAALAEATEGLIGADGGTVGGVLRMKNPKIATDDDTDHDIAVVPNAAGAGLQLQFPGGNTAMVRAKSGTLATVAEVNAAAAAEAEAREQAIAKIELTPGPQGPQGPKGDPGDPATVPIDTTMPAEPSDAKVPSTKLLKDYINGLVGDIDAALAQI